MSSLKHCVMNAVPGAGYGSALCVEARACEIPGRGVGLFALRPIAAREVVFIERPVVAVADVFSDTQAGPSGRRCCATCLASLVPNPWGDAVPMADSYWPQFTVSECPGGCGEVYCAGRWRSCEQQRRLGHDRMCTHRKAYAALVAYCDTELPEAWDCMRAAILLAVHLLAMLLTEAETVADETARPLQRFYDQLTGGDTNRVLCWVPTELCRLVAEALGMTGTDRAALTDDLLSTAIGKVFCNVISIRPLSSFSQYMSNSRSERRRDSNGHILEQLVQLADRVQREECREGDEGDDAVSASAIKPAMLDSFFSARTGESASAVYALHSKLNHSCAPNVHVVSGSFVDAAVEVVALTDVATGEELCVSYTDPKLSHAQRRRALLNNHFFVCNCAECAAS